MNHAAVPMRTVGPMKLVFGAAAELIKVPLATYESPLWPSIARGARVSRLGVGISVLLHKDIMTRSVVLEAPSAVYANQVANELPLHKDALAEVLTNLSSFTVLEGWHIEIVGKLLYIRFSFSTGDAAGHNMSTKAADTLLKKICEHFVQLKYVSISGNICVDKKTSAINGILGRGKYVIAEMRVPRELCSKYLRATPEQIVELNIKKNLLGSVLAGSIRTANAHFANMLLAFYLATGQDAANIVEGSQGIVYAQAEENNLYFSVTLPNVIVGTIGVGKELDFVRQNLEMLGCTQKQKLGENAKRLAMIAAATVWCGELSLLAAQVNQGELVASHERIERKSGLKSC